MTTKSSENTISDGRWVVKVDDWREFKRPVLSNGDLVDVVHAVDRHL